MSNIAWPPQIAASARELESAWATKRLGHALLLVCESFGDADEAAKTLSEALLKGKLPHADYMTVQPANKQRQIGVEAMRELREFLQKSSLTGTKVAHISQADRLSNASGNLFLKVLEEPPQDSYIIMTTDEPYAVLPTILSRAMRFRLKSVHKKERQEALEDWAGSFKEFMTGAQSTELMPRMALIEGAYKILQDGEDEKTTTTDEEELPKEIKEALEAARQKAFKKEFYRTLERVALEIYEEAPQESHKLRTALQAVERVYSLTEFNLNTAAALEAAITGVVEALAPSA